MGVYQIIRHMLYSTQKIMLDAIMLAIYKHSVKKLDIISITVEYLTKVHAYNERGAANSLIEQPNKRLFKCRLILMSLSIQSVKK